MEHLIKNFLGLKFNYKMRYLVLISALTMPSLVYIIFNFQAEFIEMELLKLLIASIVINSLSILLLTCILILIQFLMYLRRKKFIEKLTVLFKQSLDETQCIKIDLNNEKLNDQIALVDLYNKFEELQEYIGNFTDISFNLFEAAINLILFSIIIVLFPGSMSISEFDFYLIFKIFVDYILVLSVFLFIGRMLVDNKKVKMFKQIFDINRESKSNVQEVI